MSSTTSIDVPGSAWAEAWQQSWDAQQAGFLFDREQRFSALLDLVEVAAGPDPDRRRPGLRHGVDHPPPAGPAARGAGRGGRRRPGAAHHRPRVARRRRAGAHHPGRPARPGLGRGARAASRPTPSSPPPPSTGCPRPTCARVYRDLHSVVRPGGLVANADTMPADGLLRAQRRAHGAGRAARRRRAGRRHRVLARLVGAGRRRSGARRADGRAGGAVRRRRPPALVQPPGRVAPRRPRRRRASPRSAWPGAPAPTPSSPPSADRRLGRCRPRRDWSPAAGSRAGAPPPPDAEQAWVRSVAAEAMRTDDRLGPDVVDG